MVITYCYYIETLILSLSLSVYHRQDRISWIIVWIIRRLPVILFVDLNKHLIINVVNSRCLTKHDDPSYRPYVLANRQIITQRGYKHRDYAERFIMANNGRLSDGQRYHVMYQRVHDREYWPDTALYGHLSGRQRYGIVFQREWEFYGGGITIYKDATLVS